MHRNRLIVVLKLAVVTGLMTYVLSSIQWRDTLTVVDASGQVVEEVTGRIVGRWDGSTVRFRPDSATEPESAERLVEQGPTGTGERIQVTPGFTTYLRNLDGFLFVLGSLCYVASVVFSGTRWWWLLRVNDLPVGYLQALRYTWIGVFFNNVVPGQTGGDVIKAVYVVRRCPTGRVEAAVSVVVDRVLGLMSLALLAALMVLFFLDRFQAVAVAVWGLIGCGVLVGVVFFSRRIRTALRLDSLVRRLPKRVHRLMLRVDEAVFLYRGHKAGVGLWLLAGLLNHAVSVTSVVFIGHALGVGLPTVEYYVLVPVINMVSAIPIAPNGWGIGEAMFGNLFAKYGAVYLPGVTGAEQVMRTRGVALSLLFRVQMSIVSLLGGLMMLLQKEGPAGRDLEQAIEADPREDVPR